MPYKVLVEYCISHPLYILYTHFRIHLEYPLRYLIEYPAIPYRISYRIHFGMHLRIEYSIEKPIECYIDKDPYKEIRKSPRSENSSIKLYLTVQEILNKGNQRCGRIASKIPCRMPCLYTQKEFHIEYPK